MGRLHIEKSDENTVQDAEHFEGGRGLLISDPEWDGSDAMPLQFREDAAIHIYGDKPQMLFDYAKEALSEIGLNVIFEPVPQINLSLTDHYEIAEASGGAILSKDMPGNELRDTEVLRSQIADVLSEKIESAVEENPHLGSVKLNIYATGPKTATVEAFNSIQLLANTLQENGISLQADFMHLNRETGEYFPQEVWLACERKIAPEMPNAKALAKGLYPEKAEIVFEICEGRHGANPLITHDAVYGSSIPKEAMTDPEQVQNDIAWRVWDIIKSESRQRTFDGNLRPVEYTVCDVASGEPMPLVAFLNAMVDQNQEAVVYQYDADSQEYFRQEAVTVMYKDVVREIGENELEIEPLEKDDDMEL